MATRLFLVCHAATASTRKAVFPTGHEPVEPAGLRHVDAVARALPACRYRLTSPAVAAVQTAASLGGAAATIDPALRDCDYGRWSGRALAAVQDEEPQAFATWMQDAQAAPHGGESLAGVLARVAAWLEARQELAGSCLAVTHAAVIRAAILLAIAAEPRSFWRIDVAPLTVVRLNGQAGRWTLAALSPAKP
jgi:broad specificity phosphatase PhoE